MSGFDSPKLADEFCRRYSLNRGIFNSGHKTSFNEKLDKIIYDSSDEQGCKSE